MCDSRVRALRGGNLNNGANDGAFNVNVNNGLTNANANIGCRLSACLSSALICHHLLVDCFAYTMLVVWRKLIRRLHAEVAV